VSSVVEVRRARTGDVRGIRALVAPLARNRILLNKEAVTYYEALQQFWVAVASGDAGGVVAGGASGGSGGAGEVVGCAALHVIWEDLAEIRTLAVSPEYRRRGVGDQLLDSLVSDARALGVERLFCLTFETEFFGRHGFSPIDGQAVTPEVYAELLRSYDEGVAEFLDLERVKPNTLGNTRMLRSL